MYIHAEHEKAKAILGLSWSPSCVCHPLHRNCFRIQSQSPWHQCGKFLGPTPCLVSLLPLKTLSSMSIHYASFLETLIFGLLLYFIWQIGDLQKGLNPPSWNMLIFSGTHLGLVIKTGIITGIIALTVS